MVDAFALVLGIVAAAGDEVGGVTVLCDVGGVALPGVAEAAVVGGGVCPSRDGGPPGDGGVGPPV